MNIGILKEAAPERRVCLLPESAAALVKLGTGVLVEKDAGGTAFAFDADYEAAGAKTATKEQVIAGSDLLIKVNPPTDAEIAMMKEGQVIIAVLNPFFNTTVVKTLASKGITSFSMDVIPRTTRAQAMDILSSMATVAGYKAVLTAANTLPKFFPMFMTAAGTITPAKVLILGAGVAGLQSIATSRKLGAVVEVFDVRSAVKEEVIGLGGKFVEVEGALDDKAAGGYAVEQNEEFKRETGCSHSRPCRKIGCGDLHRPDTRETAPLLLTKETVAAMKPGSVIIDLAASTGGNCELTKNDETVVHNGVKIIGNSFFAVDMPSDSSKMYGKNVLNFLKLMITQKGELNLNWEDDIVKGTCVTHNKEIVHERIKAVINS